MIPHINDPQKKSLLKLDQNVQELVARAQKGRLTPQELAFGSVSISNLGMYEIDGVVPIIYPGEVAMLGIGRAQKRASSKDGKLVIGDFMNISLSLDHRVVDGADGARFLQSLKTILEGDHIHWVFA